MSTLTLTFYGEIGFSWWGDGATASEVAEKLAEHPTAETIDVRINSPGGDVFDAVTILARLQQHPARVVVHIDGLAASAASVIAMAGDEIRISEGGFLMIHEASAVSVGRASDHQKAADILASINQSMADVYSRRSQRGKDQLLAAMDAETWYCAHEAVAAGLADAVVPDGEVPGEVTACVGRGRFRNPPPGLGIVTNAQSARRMPPLQIPKHIQQTLAALSPKDTTTMDPSLLISALGLSAESDEPAILRAIADLRSERADLAGQVEALNAELSGLRADSERTALDGKLAALKAAARITDTQEQIVRDLFAAGHTDKATELAESFEDASPVAPTGPRQSLKADDAGSNTRPDTRQASGDIDWQALVGEIPAHIRELAGPTLSANPRAYIMANRHTPWASALGIDWGSVPHRKE